MVDFFSDGLLLPLCSHWLPFGFSNLFQFRRKGMMSSVHFIWDYVSYLTTPDNREGKFSCFLRSGFILRWCDLVCWFWVHDVETGQLRATARPSHMYAGLILNPRHFGLSSPNSFPHSHNQSNAPPLFFFFLKEGNRGLFPKKPETMEEGNWDFWHAFQNASCGICHTTLRVVRNHEQRAFTWQSRVEISTLLPFCFVTLGPFLHL